jgi:hypothetical protein
MGGIGGMGGNYGEFGGMGPGPFSAPGMSPMDNFGGNLMGDWFRQENIIPIIHVKKRHNKMGNQ